MWLNRRRAVTSPARPSASVNSGTHSVIGASRSSTGSASVPRRRQRHDRGRDEGLGHDARWNIVSGVTGAPLPMSRTPNPRDTTLPVAHHRNGQTCRVMRAEKGLDQRPQAFFDAPPKAIRTHVHGPTLTLGEVRLLPHRGWFMSLGVVVDLEDCVEELPGFRALGAGEDLLRCALFEQLTVVEEAHPVCHLAREPHLVGDDEHGHPR